MFAIYFNFWLQSIGINSAQNLNEQQYTILTQFTQMGPKLQLNTLDGSVLVVNIISTPRQ